MGKKRAAKPKKILATSQGRLALALGVSDRMVRKLFDRDDWPFGREAPFDVPAVAAWRIRHQGKRIKGAKTDDAAYMKAMRTAGLDPVTEQQAEAVTSLASEHLKAKIRKLDREHEVAMGRLIDRELSDRQYIGMCNWIKERINQWVESMPTLFVGAGEDRIRKLSRDSWDRICEDAYVNASRQLATMGEVERVRAMTDENKSRAVTRRGKKRRIK